ncbi:MAG TPA: glycogen synthase GlgA [Candidatus Saccharimonadales bacterium]|nr:glycogen synthase GlgA [Candidatus Saccharimonadales bacterium]
MKILLASSEVHPYSKSGGLADMVGALAKTLGRAGDHTVGLVTPLYKGIRERFPLLHKTDISFPVPLGPRSVSAQVWSHAPSPGLTIYFIEQPEFFERAGLYGENGVDYPDNPERFIFFSKCIAHLARHLPWKPEIVHLHDWQTGLVPVFILHQKLTEGWGTTPHTVFTIHNLAYQGSFPSSTYPLTNLPLDYFNLNGLEFYGQLNCLKAGIVYSDAITTVSPRYAREITTEAYGCALDPVLRLRQESLHGILNGVDYEEWNTEANPNLKHPYSAAVLTGKAQIKAELQAEFGLPIDPNVPLFGNITRLAEQKGVDIQLGALEEMLAANMQFVLLGSGSPDYEKAYAQLVKRYPTKASIRLGFNQALSHRIEAGSDFFLMPSRYEPCGLNQMYSLRYGTVPIVRITGGLDDSVVDINEDTEHANGIKFEEYSVRALAKAIRKALVLYENPELLAHYRQNGMQADFSWERTAQEYRMVYEEAMGR